MNEIKVGDLVKVAAPNTHPICLVTAIVLDTETLSWPGYALVCYGSRKWWHQAQCCEKL